MRDPGGTYALGVMLDEGLGLAIDEHRAFEWYLCTDSEGTQSQASLGRGRSFQHRDDPNPCFISSESRRDCRNFSNFRDPQTDKPFCSAFVVKLARYTY